MKKKELRSWCSSFALCWAGEQVSRCWRTGTREVGLLAAHLLCAGPSCPRFYWNHLLPCKIRGSTFDLQMRKWPQRRARTLSRGTESNPGCRTPEQEGSQQPQAGWGSQWRGREGPAIVVLLDRISPQFQEKVYSLHPDCSLCGLPPPHPPQ